MRCECSSKSNNSFDINSFFQIVCTFHVQEAWFAPAKDSKHATGYIEERLKNVRKRMPKQSWTPAQTKKEDKQELSVADKIKKRRESMGRLCCVCLCIGCLLF